MFSLFHICSSLIVRRNIAKVFFFNVYLSSLPMQFIKRIKRMYIIIIDTEIIRQTERLSLWKGFWTVTQPKLDKYNTWIMRYLLSNELQYTSVGHHAFNWSPDSTRWVSLIYFSIAKVINCVTLLCRFSLLRKVFIWVSFYKV